MSYSFGDLFTFEDVIGDRHEKQFSSCILLKDLGNHKKNEKITSILFDNSNANLIISDETEEGVEIYEQYIPNYTLKKSN